MSCCDQITSLIKIPAAPIPKENHITRHAGCLLRALAQPQKLGAVFGDEQFRIYLWDKLRFGERLRVSVKRTGEVVGVCECDPLAHTAYDPTSLLQLRQIVRPNTSKAA